LDTEQRQIKQTTKHKTTRTPPKITSEPRCYGKGSSSCLYFTRHPPFYS